MGLAVWYYRRRLPGELEPLAAKSVQRFVFDGGELPAGDDGFIYYAQVLVHLQERRAIEVVHLGFFKMRAGADGTMDRDYDWKVREASQLAAFGQYTLAPPPAGVIQAADRFAKRTLDHLHTWQPEKVDLRALRELVNARAKAELL